MTVRAWQRALAQPSFATVVGNAAYAASLLGVLIVLARLTTAAEVGRYALALAITSPIQIGLGMRLRTARVMMDARTFPLRTYFNVGMLTAATAAMLSTAIAYLVIPDQRTRIVVLVVALSKGVESLIDISYGELQRHGQMAAIAKSQLLRGVLTLCAATGGVLLGQGVVGAAVAINLAWVAQFIALDVRRAAARTRLVTPGAMGHTRWGLASQLAKRSWPLGLAAALTSFTDAAPRYLVASLLGTGKLGVFAVLAYPTMVMAVFANSLGQSYLVQLRDAFRDEDRRRLTRLSAKMSALVGALGLAAVLVLVFLGSAGMSVILGSAYGSYFDLGLILLGVAIVGGLATVQYYVLTSTGRFSRHPLVMTLVALTGVPATWLTTQAWGLTGAAWGMMLTLALQCSLMSLMVHAQLRRRRQPRWESS